MPDAKRRTCCNSHLGYPHQPDCPRRGGRPVTTGETPTRSAGRHGKIWEDCEAQARADGQDMTAFIRDAITRELDRRRALARRQLHNGPTVTTTAARPASRRWVPGRVCSCDDDDCGGTCAGSRPADVSVFTRPDGTTFEARPAVGGYVYTTPGARHCRCTFLGEGTPEHDVSPMCEALMPDADRDPDAGFGTADD